MPRNPGPIHPRVKDMRAYDAALRQSYLDPMFRRLGRRLAQAEAANQAWRAMDDVVGDVMAQPRAGVPLEQVEMNLGKMEGYHTGRVKQSFRSALALDITPLLSEVEITSFMGQKIRDNVNLIRTIPPRMHDGLRKRIEKEFRVAAFDQKRLMDLFHQEYRLSGYNLRRITRDQTSKTIAGLTEIPAPPARDRRVPLAYRSGRARPPDPCGEQRPHLLVVEAATTHRAYRFGCKLQMCPPRDPDQQAAGRHQAPARGRALPCPDCDRHRQSGARGSAMETANACRGDDCRAAPAAGPSTACRAPPSCPGADTRACGYHPGRDRCRGCPGACRPAYPAVRQGWGNCT